MTLTQGGDSKAPVTTAVSTTPTPKPRNVFRNIGLFAAVLTAIAASGATGAAVATTLIESDRSKREAVEFAIKVKEEIRKAAPSLVVRGSVAPVEFKTFDQRGSQVLHVAVDIENVGAALVKADRIELKVYEATAEDFLTPSGKNGNDQAKGFGLIDLDSQNWKERIFRTTILHDGNFSGGENRGEEFDVAIPKDMKGLLKTEVTIFPSEGEMWDPKLWATTIDTSNLRTGAALNPEETGNKLPTSKAVRSGSTQSSSRARCCRPAQRANSNSTRRCAAPAQVATTVTTGCAGAVGACVIPGKKE